MIDAVPRERADAARNRRRILAAAERLFEQRGVAEVSMEAIADEAGVGKGTLFRRFGDRAGLAWALIDERERGFQDAFIRGPAPLGPGAPPCERLIAFGQAMLDRLEAPRRAHRRGRGRCPWARASGPRPTRAHRAHVMALLVELDPGGDAEYLADALLAGLGADLFLHLRRDREYAAGAPASGLGAPGARDRRRELRTASGVCQPSAAANSKRVPTQFWMKASGNRAASAWVARQPVQCVGTRNSGANSSSASQVGPMIGSKPGPLR